MIGRMPDLLPSREPTTSGQSKKTSADTSHSSYECDVCNYIYDPKIGDPDGGIPPGTPWEAIPDDWVCPVCGAGKSDFSLVT